MDDCLAVFVDEDRHVLESGRLQCLVDRPYGVILLEASTVQSLLITSAELLGQIWRTLPSASILEGRNSIAGIVFYIVFRFSY